MDTCGRSEGEHDVRWWKSERRKSQVEMEAEDPGSTTATPEGNSWEEEETEEDLPQSYFLDEDYTVSQGRKRVAASMYSQCMDSNFQRSPPLTPPRCLLNSKKKVHTRTSTILKEMQRQSNPAVSEQSSAVAGRVIYAACQQLT